MIAVGIDGTAAILGERGRREGHQQHPSDSQFPHRSTHTYLLLREPFTAIVTGSLTNRVCTLGEGRSCGLKLLRCPVHGRLVRPTLMEARCTGLIHGKE